MQNLFQVRPVALTVEPQIDVLSAVAYLYLGGVLLLRSVDIHVVPTVDDAAQHIGFEFAPAALAVGRGEVCRKRLGCCSAAQQLHQQCRSLNVVRKGCGEFVAGCGMYGVQHASRVVNQLGFAGGHVQLFHKIVDLCEQTYEVDTCL